MTPRPPKLIAVDVDGTLYDSNEQVTDRVRSSIQRARQLGIIVAIASGRPLQILPSTNAAVGGADWNVGGNGGSVRNVATGELLVDDTVSLDVAERLITGMRGVLPGVGFSLELVDSNVAEPGFNRRIPPGDPADEVDDVLDRRDPTVGVRKTIVFHDDFDERQSDLAAIAAPFVDASCESRYWTLPLVEIGRKGMDKSRALDQLIAHLGIEVHDVLAFGDGGNDFGMLTWAGTGVAMGNASDEIRAAADVVTSTNDQDGIAEYLDPLLDAMENQ